MKNKKDQILKLHVDTFLYLLSENLSWKPLETEEISHHNTKSSQHNQFK